MKILRRFLQLNPKLILHMFLNICLSRDFKWLPHTDVYRHILECRFTHFAPYVVTCWNLYKDKYLGTEGVYPNYCYNDYQQTLICYFQKHCEHILAQDVVNPLELSYCITLLLTYYAGKWHMFVETYFIMNLRNALIPMIFTSLRILFVQEYFSIFFQRVVILLFLFSIPARFLQVL
mgnify:CR=1 FL=1